jgi:uncharacterized membrane protein
MRFQLKRISGITPQREVSLARTYPLQENMVRAAPSLPVLRQISFEDVGFALRAGFEDFKARPTHVIFLMAIYPIIGIILAFATVGQNVIPLFYPLLAGFALIGPFAALGMYEISRQRELGHEITWREAFGVMRRANFSAMLGLGALLMALFIGWLALAQIIYAQTLGTPPSSVADLVTRTFYTSEGWQLLFIGNLVGLCFALLVLSISVISFPLMLDKGVRMGDAMRCSMRAMTHSPGPILAWGFIVAVLLLLGSLPFLIGLAIVLPILGHATWHLYRAVVPQ